MQGKPEQKIPLFDKEVVLPLLHPFGVWKRLSPASWLKSATIDRTGRKTVVVRWRLAAWDSNPRLHGLGVSVPTFWRCIFCEAENGAHLLHLAFVE